MLAVRVFLRKKLTNPSKFNLNMNRNETKPIDSLEKKLQGHEEDCNTGASEFNVRIREYACELCKATFNRRSNYTRHKLIHSVHPKDGNRYTCSECGRSFLQKCDLKRHLLIHQDQQPHSCQYCDKKYVRKSDLVVHTRFHTKEKAYDCDKCDKSFYQRGDLYRHQRRIHENKSSLTCGYCNKKYTKDTTLIRHMQSAHKDVILMSLGEKLTQQTTRSVMEEPPIVVAVPQDVLNNVNLTLQPEGAEDSNSSDRSVVMETVNTQGAQLQHGSNGSYTNIENSSVSSPQTSLVFPNAETVIVTDDAVKMGITSIEFSDTGTVRLQTESNATSSIVIHTIEEGSLKEKV